ncbi:MAG TPA: hypothetical protein EYH50_03995 [Pyrodictium delaneyi]|uniref:Permease n=1 Tax=Pyrodictium delaneyi TaxID=1273541 RepID=A0A832ZUK8_9CREN|nr:hypothetical protein [Pyrodictium delaneyi]
MARVVTAAVLFAIGLYTGYSEDAGRLSKAISRLLLWFSLPFILLHKVYTVDPATAIKYTMLVVVSVVGSLVTAVVGIPRLLRELPASGIGAAILAAGIHNSAFLPIPLMLILYGDAGPAALYSAIVNIISVIAVPIVVGMYSEKETEEDTVKRITRSLSRFPPFYALVAGIALRTLLPSDCGPVYALLEILGRMAAELTISSFYLVGAVLAVSGLAVDRPTLVIAAWRLIVEPLLAVGASIALGLEGVWLAGALIEACMPPATMNIVFAITYGLDEKLVARAIGFTMPLSIVVAVLIRLFVVAP